MKNPEFIAEVTPITPYGFESDKTWEELFKLANRHADMISIHTDRPWGGSIEDIEVAKSMTDKPIIARCAFGDDATIQRALDAGAHEVIVTGRIPDSSVRSRCWIEPQSISQIEDWDLSFLDVVVWNGQDLFTGTSKVGLFKAARTLVEGELVQAGFIHTPRDVHPHANKFIVGQHLEEFVRDW